MEGNRGKRTAELRHTLLALHKAMLDAQRILYEREHGRLETTSQFLGLVLEHPDFEWIRELSALIAQLDEWAEDVDASSEAGLDTLVDALRSLIRPEGANPAFTARYWKMVEDEPHVTVAHVKAWRLVGPANGARAPS